MHLKSMLVISSVAATCFCFADAPVTPDGVLLIDQQHALVGGIGNGNYDLSGFPVTITVPGTYRLASNLVVPTPDSDGIDVLSDNVVIDLNGFSISGPTVCPIGSTTTSNTGETIVTSCSPTGAGIGIKAGDPFTTSSSGPVANGHVGVRVMNGTVTGMGNVGIILGPGGRIENVTVSSNGGHGILSGVGSIVRNDIAIGNGGIGFFVGNESLSDSNVSTLNKNHGLEVGSGLTIGNVGVKNGGFGIILFGDGLKQVIVNNSNQP